MLASAANVLWHKGPVGLASATLAAARINISRDVFGKRFIKKRIHGYWMYLDTMDPGISRTLLLFGSREEDHRIILERVLRPGMRILDIGANIGYYVLMERSLIGPEGHIIAVEASPANTDLLKMSLDENGADNVTVRPLAVSDEPGIRKFHLSELSNLNTFEGSGDAAQRLTGEVIDVETKTVPQIAAEFGAPALIRMDVEGHEVEIFNGMLDAVESGELSPMIIFETHIRRYAPDHDFVGPLERMFAAGYRVRYLSSSSERGTKIINDLGYKGEPPFRTDFKWRAIYENIEPNHAIDLICRTGGARTVLLEMPHA